MMEKHEEFTKWAVERGVKIDGIKAHKFEGRGLGIIAQKKIEANTTFLTIPTTALRTAYSVPKTISTPLAKAATILSLPLTIHSLLAVDLALDTASPTPTRAPWLSVLPTFSNFSTMPLLYPPSLQNLLPSACTALLQNQKQKLEKDWKIATLAFSQLKYEAYLHAWLLIGTRTFYYVKNNTKTPKNRDDCLAQSPFADYFNHTSSPTACTVSFTASGYQVVTPVAIQKGQEIYISYGNHSNDFLLAEYGFILSDSENIWDEVLLDSILIPILEQKGKRGVLEEEGFWGKWVLDRKGVCHRTQVALRSLVIPEGKWRRFVEGKDYGEREETEVDGVLGKVLERFKQEIETKIKALDGLSEGSDGQRDIVGRRWKQIEGLVEAATERIEK